MSKTYTQAQRDADIEAAIDDIEATFQAKLNMVFEAWELEREQVFALVSAVEILLNPNPDEKAPRINELRICQVVSTMLGSTRDYNAMKRIAGVNHAD